MELLKNKILVVIICQLLIFIVFLVDFVFSHVLTNDNMILLETIFIVLVFIYFFATNYVNNELGYEKRKENRKEGQT